MHSSTMPFVITIMTILPFFIEPTISATLPRNIPAHHEHSLHNSPSHSPTQPRILSGRPNLTHDSVSSIRPSASFNAGSPFSHPEHTPVSVTHSAQGSCPGVGVIQLRQGGKSGKLITVLRSTNTVDNAPVSAPGGHLYDGAERSDVHGVSVISKKSW